MDRNAENKLRKNQLITSKNEILETLLQSKNEGNILGILSSSLGTGMFLYQVKDVLSDEDENDFIIVLKRAEFTAITTDPIVLYLNEIQSLCSFAMTSDNN